MSSIAISDIRTLVRYLLLDYSHSQVPGDIFTYTTSAVFTLSEPNAVSVSSVLQNDSELSSSDYSYDSSTNKVTISASLTSGDTIEVQYTHFPDFSNNEVDSAIRAAVVHLSIKNFYTFEIGSDDYVYPEPLDSEQNLIAFVASIILKPDNKSYRLPDISITMPAGTLPLDNIISRAIAIFKNNTHGVFSIIGD